MEPLIPHAPADAAEPSLQPLAPKVRTAWRVQLTLLVTLATVGTFIYELFAVLGEPDRWLPLGVRTAAVLGIGLVLIVLVPRWRYRFWRYALREEELYLERGIWNRVRTVVPLRRIQHLDVSQNLLEREFDLGKLIVHTAGARSSDVVVPGLHFEEAERLRETLKHYILEDAL